MIASQMERGQSINDFFGIFDTGRFVHCVHSGDWLVLMGSVRETWALLQMSRERINKFRLDQCVYPQEEDGKIKCRRENCHQSF